MEAGVRKASKEETAGEYAPAAVAWRGSTIYDCPTRQTGDLVSKSPGIGRISVKDAYSRNAPC